IRVLSTPVLSLLLLRTSSRFYSFLLFSSVLLLCPLFFFFIDTAPTEIYTLSLHDALPIFHFTNHSRDLFGPHAGNGAGRVQHHLDRKSTRLNSSHVKISYAVFCLKKKKKKKTT